MTEGVDSDSVNRGVETARTARQTKKLGLRPMAGAVWSRLSVALDFLVVEGDTRTVAGHVADRNPIEQVTAAARWLENVLKKSAGKRFFVRGVVVFPGWFVEQRAPRGDVWVLEPKALPAFIGNAPAMISAADVALAAYQLSRYVRSSSAEKLGQ